MYIPDLPPGVRYTEPKLIDKPAKDAAATKKQLENYEKANRENKFAIKQAIDHNKKQQKVYNTKPKKEPENSSWFKNPLTGDWKLW